MLLDYLKGKGAGKMNEEFKEYVKENGLCKYFIGCFLEMDGYELFGMLLGFTTISLIFAGILYFG